MDFSTADLCDRHEAMLCNGGVAEPLRVAALIVWVS